jgi:hypothetical protein
VSPNTRGLRDDPQQGNGRSSLNASVKTVRLGDDQYPVQGEAATTYKTRGAGKRRPGNLLLSPSAGSPPSHFYPGNFRIFIVSVYQALRLRPSSFINLRPSTIDAFAALRLSHLTYRMAHFTQPGYFPGGYMQTPSQPPFQNLPGFPRGFPAARYVQQPVHAPPLAQVTPDMVNFPLQHEEHDLWPPAPTDSEATQSESEGDSDDSTVLANTPHRLRQAYYSDRNPPRGRSNSRSAARHRDKGASHFFPREQSSVYLQIYVGSY